MAGHHEYALDLRRIDDCVKGIPEEVVVTYADYYTHTFNDFEDDWYLREREEFYRTMVDKGSWKERDFTKVPTREVWELFAYYNSLPEGTARMEYRLQHKELNDWLVLAKGYKPAEKLKTMRLPNTVVPRDSAPVAARPSHREQPSKPMNPNSRVLARRTIC